MDLTDLTCSARSHVDTNWRYPDHAGEFLPPRFVQYSPSFITIDWCDTVSSVLRFCPTEFLTSAYSDEEYRIHPQQWPLARCYSFLHVALYIVTNSKARADLFPERL
jgi:hypothetical protein